MSDRDIVVVDVETTGLDPEHHLCVEVAWWNLTTDERGSFIPHHDVSEALAEADIKALQLNRYIDRIADQQQDVDGTETKRLAGILAGHTLAGSNPSFDSGFLRNLFAAAARQKLCATPVWHHRMWDLAAYAAGVLSLDYLPGLAEVCKLVDVEVGPDHSAEVDVTATGQCFRALFSRAAVICGRPA